MRLLAFLLLALPVFADRGAAQSALADGDARLARGDFPGAEAAYTRAIEADPTWAQAWGKRGDARSAGALGPSCIEDYNQALALQPGDFSLMFYRAQAYLMYDRPEQAIGDLDALLKLAPNHPESVSLRGMALVLSGDVDGGLAEQDRALKGDNNNPTLRVRGEALARKGDWKGLVDEIDARRAAGIVQMADVWYRVVALVELGRWEDAAAAAKAVEGADRMVASACRLYLESTPQAGAQFKPDQAERDLKTLADSKFDSNQIVNQGRALLLTGRPADALNLLTMRGRRTHFGTAFWTGAAYWKLGKLAEARVALRDAFRLNPYMVGHAGRIEGFAEFAASVAGELKGDRVEAADRGKLGHELATHLLTVAEIEGLVRNYRFQRAADEYEILQKSLVSAVRRTEIDARLPEVKGMASALAKVVAMVNKAAGKTKVKVGSMELTITKADASGFDFTIPKGSGRFPWAALDTAIFCALAADADPTPEERLSLGCLAWDAGERELAVKSFEEASKKKPALKAGVAAFVARRRGIATPKDGFLLSKGQYVTAEEKANYDKGLVPFEGQWVTPKDREQLAKGLVKAGDKWVSGDEAALLNQGFRKYKGQWTSREDIEAIRSKWEEAWVEETAHFRIRTNEGEGFAKELALVAEPAYAALKEYYGEEPKLAGNEKMELFAFRTFEDYRRYCLEKKAEAQLNAAGFAASDSMTVVGWNRTHNQQMFLQTMTHEAAHLFWYRIAPGAKAPSWFAEGMATGFEGFSWDGKAYRFNFVSESRLPFARDAMKAGRQLSLADVTGGDALTLINSDPQKALLFYAECWSLNYYLTHAPSKATRDAYAEYRLSISKGGADPLTKFFPDAAKLEKEWVEYVKGM
ncbi:MAG: tetratricopeptide repeat protein [Planctomycetes bacterium]|nr:tetratricopeptide repeat protein [Planctomycetota bacterium]